MHRMSRFNIVAVALGLAFLYLPIAILVIYSFNASRLVTVWGGWSLEWYRVLAHDQAILDAAWISIRVAALSASAATVLGTCAAVALVRYGRFRGRLLFTSMVYAPLVMPDIITGLALLLLFVAANVDRGFWTIVIAHTTLTLCFVTVIVQARLIGFDRALEEAAQDLGCPPFKHLHARDAAADHAGDRRRLDAGVLVVAGRSGDRQLHHRPGRDHAADPHLFGGALGREAGDQRGLHHHDRDRGGGHHHGVAARPSAARCGANARWRRGCNSSLTSPWRGEVDRRRVATAVGRG